MRFLGALGLTILFVSAATAQTFSTRCQAEEVTTDVQTIDLRLIGCGEGFPDNLLWHLDRADSLTGELDSFVTRTLTGKGAVVYMFDTGVMSSHDEFMRADGSVVIGAVHPYGTGRGCPNGDDPALDPCYDSDAALFAYTHGTATASMVAGRNTGVAPDAKIVAVWGDTAANDITSWIGTFDAIIKHAWDPATPQFHTAIINMSFVPNYASANDPKFPRFEKKMREMIGGVDANGNPDPNGKRFLFTTIAGNLGQGPQCDSAGNSNLYPGVLGSSIDGLITVGGIDETNHLWAGSCKGPAIDVLAPAANLFVASISGHDHYRSGIVPEGAVPGNSGTSYAAPFVAGIAALLLEKNPDYTPEQLETIIKATSTRVANADETTAGG
ncbi:MAG TPA: S8 family serine peptidase, partial [Thermoanaerobaculia bacterium]